MSEKWIINNIFLLKVCYFFLALFLSWKLRQTVLRKHFKHQELLLFFIGIAYMVFVVILFSIEEIISQQQVPRYLLYMLMGSIILSVPVLWYDHKYKKRHKDDTSQDQ